MIIEQMNHLMMSKSWQVIDNKRIKESYYIIIFTFYSIEHKPTPSMNAQNSSQSQSSYLKTIEEKPNFEAVQSTQLLDQSSAITAMTGLATSMAMEEGQKFEECLNSLNALFEKGYSYLFLTHPLLMRKMMNHFTKLGKQLEVNSNLNQDEEDSKKQLRMLFVLSMIAQLLRDNPKFYYPFTRKFLLTVFSIDAELLQNLPIKNQILAVLAVIYENLSRQPKLVTKYSIESNLKQAVLGNYKLIQEVFTLKIMNKTISNLVSKGITFSVAEYHKYKVLETVSRIIAHNQMELFLIKMKMTVLNLNLQRKPQDITEIKKQNAMERC